MAAQDDAEIIMEGNPERDLMEIQDRIVMEALLWKYWKQ
jgi:hypothetical protein